jgi:hypothetical protein
MTKVLEALRAAEHYATPSGGLVGGWVKASRRGGWCAVGWRCRHDALVMWLLLRQDATHEGLCGAAWLAGPQVLLLPGVDGRGAASSDKVVTECWKG